MPLAQPRTEAISDTDLGPQLLRLAREAIAHHLGLGPAPAPGDDPALDERGATFVTLIVAGELRGSVGSMRRSRSLAADVVANAIAASQILAFRRSTRRHSHRRKSRFRCWTSRSSSILPTRPTCFANCARSRTG